jgi:hypothetical protein
LRTFKRFLNRMRHHTRAFISYAGDCASCKCILIGALSAECFAFAIGPWILFGSLYLIQGAIMIGNDSILTIAPVVKV